MIQLANDPNATRPGWRPSARSPAPAAASPRRPGHAWPFLSRPAQRPEAVSSDKPRQTETGS